MRGRKWRRVEGEWSRRGPENEAGCGRLRVTFTLDLCLKLIDVWWLQLDLAGVKVDPNSTYSVTKLEGQE